MRHYGYQGSKWAALPEIARWLAGHVPWSQRNAMWNFVCQGLLQAAPSSCAADPVTGDPNIYDSGLTLHDLWQGPRGSPS